MNAQEIEREIQQVADSHGPQDAARIMKAYHFADKYHEGQVRKSGEPYVIHPVKTASILNNEFGLDVESVIAGLLHDCIEDTDATFQLIQKEFGTSVAQLVDGVTKLGKIVYFSKEEEQMEDLRKMFLAMAKDIRVIIIKLADRLHNMRTLQFKNMRKQQETSLETMEIYAPLAHRLGMQNLKWELEDLAMQRLDPVGYQEITDYLKDRSTAYSEFIDVTQIRIKEKVEQAGISCEIKGRLKHVYSIYRKLYGQNLNFSEMYDICAVRVIVQEVTECYYVMGLIHDLYRPVPGRFKDYISTPKPNGYQSLHTVVIGREGIPFEVQIRTKEMDNAAEYGIAAHWKYKDGLKGAQNEETFAWIRQLLESQQDTDAADFIKSIKVDLFAEEVFVFTPRGDVINLPQGAIPIDFAYAIHSEVGNRMVGAKVNGRIVNIDYHLQNGEIVEVITSKTSTGPKRDWIKMVKTAEARNKIKQWFKKERREENIEQGRTELERELRANLLWDDFQQEEIYSIILKRFTFNSLDELYGSIGYGGITVNRVVNKVKEEAAKLARSKGLAAVKVPQPPKKRPVANTGVIVEGIDNCLVKFAKCCTPVPGDSIIGFVTRGYGVSVHRVECANVQNGLKNEQEAGRWIHTEWDFTEKHYYNTALRVSAKTRMGALGDVVTLFGNMKIKITELNVKDMDDGYSNFYITASVNGKEQLELLMNRLKKCVGVTDVVRSISGS